MDYEQACSALHSVSMLGSKLGLDSMSRLCPLLGDPQDKLSFVHVAGTNGKGSTCTMIASVLKAAGYKTGLYVSPHLEDYRDSFYMDGVKISEEDFASVVSTVYSQAVKMEDEGLHATEFEILTAAAFVWFFKNECDIVVLETGLGGRLDATNIVKNTLVSVITSISLDHTAFLGETIEEITQEKCGIIKEFGTTVSYPKQEQKVAKIIEKNTEEKGNMLVVPSIDELEILRLDIEGTDFSYRGKILHVSLSGSYQPINAVTAIETVNVLKDRHGFMIPQSAVEKGINSAYLPARQEVLSRRPLIMLDGAHNLQGIEALAEFIETEFSHKHVIVVMGMLCDKQYEKSIAVMAKLCKQFIAVPPGNPRTWDIEVARKIASGYCERVSANSDVYKAAEEAVMSCPENGAIVICGSLYLASKAKEAIKKLKTLLV